MCACLACGRSSGLTRYGQILCSSLPPNVAYCLGDAIRLGSVSYCVRARLYRGWLSGLSKLCQIARVDKIIGGDLPRWRKLMCRMCVGVFAFMSIALFDVRVSIHAVTSLTWYHPTLVFESLPISVLMVRLNPPPMDLTSPSIEHSARQGHVYTVVAENLVGKALCL